MRVEIFAQAKIQPEPLDDVSRNKLERKKGNQRWFPFSALAAATFAGQGPARSLRSSEAEPLMGDGRNRRAKP